MVTHPPDDYVLRDLGIESWLEAEDRARAVLPVTDSIRDRSGTVTLGALATLVDVACARVAFIAARPDWVATVDLSLAMGEPVTHGMVNAEARLVKAGSGIISIVVDLRAAGTATASFTRLPGKVTQVPPQALPIGFRKIWPRFAPPLACSIQDRMGIRNTDEGTEVNLTNYVRNAFGTLNGGVVAFLAAAAAEQTTGPSPTDLTLRYLGQTRVGPARATGSVVRAVPGHAVSDIEIIDIGAANLIVARATVTTMRR
jgi:uncharacterized protein (TIGR00369 family)